MPIIQPIYIDQSALETIVSLNSDLSSSKKIVATFSDDSTKKSDINGKIGAGLQLPSFINQIAKVNLDASTKGEVSSEEIKKESQRIEYELKTSIFSQFISQVSVFEKNGELINPKEIKDFENLKSGDFVKLTCKISRNSLSDSLKLIYNLINLFFTTIQEQNIKKIAAESFSNPQSIGEMTTQLEVKAGYEILKLQNNNVDLYAFLKVLETLMPQIEAGKIDVLNLHIEGFGGKYNTLVFCEKSNFIGSVEKVYGNTFTVIGKVNENLKNSEYSLFESTIYGQLDKKILEKIEKFVESIPSLFNGIKISDITDQFDSQTKKIRISGNIIKIIPVVIYN